MLIFSKENGYPMTIIFETNPYEEVMEDNEVWKGYESIISDEDCNIIAKFIHKEMFDRVTWSRGFFAAITLNNPNFNNEWNKKVLWKDPEKPLIGEDGMSNLDVWDWIVTKEDKVMRITHHDDADVPFEIIARFATRGEAKNAKEINELVQDLKREKASNRSSWDMYGFLYLLSE